ncbi:MAG: NAD(P)-binding protein [Opitutales bacterium]|nr:NAD(P)-binding protein [Opitutales bacterium]
MPSHNPSSISRKSNTFDFLIVGAGFSGLVAAERLCALGKRCLVVEKRDHIGGNAYDCYDSHGVLIHPYGPHYFRTNSGKILKYLSRFTEWIPGDYRVQVFREGRYWSFPINLKTFEQYIGRSASPEEMQEWLESQKIPFARITNSEEAVLSQVGPSWYKMFFENYTLKQWKLHPRELSASVCQRIPVRTTRDDRYFNDKFQVLPKHGYHVLFENLVKACGKNLEIRLNTDYKDIIADPSISWQHMVFTGPIDTYFDYKFGPLPYRSLKFEHEHFSAETLKKQRTKHKEQRTKNEEPETKNHSFLQPCVQVNYPDPSVPYTRCVEAKHITGQKIEGTTLIKEYPEAYETTNEPYYPIPNAASQKIYKQYEAEAKKLKNVSFIGRLGTYRYYNMDQVVGMALSFCKNF